LQQNRRVYSKEGLTYVMAAMGKRVVVIHLDGTAEAQRAANAIADLQLTPDNVADYVRFYCAHLRYENGSLLDIADGPAGAQAYGFDPLRFEEVDYQGCYCLTGFVRHNQKIVRLTFIVTGGGAVLMEDDDAGETIEAVRAKAH
jgi:hypothetical protein